MTTYLTGVTNPTVEARVADGLDLGLLIQPRSGYFRRIANFPVWAADNGAFSKVAEFDAALFRKMLNRPELIEARDRCEFVAAPDELVVLEDGTVIGDAAGTLAKFGAWAREIRALGYPVAMVAQDGVENMLDQIEWDLVDVIFLGGSTEWKVGLGGRLIAQAAKARGKRVHMGRVNSARRFRLAHAMECDTADGTFLAFGTDANLPRLESWIGEAA